MCLALTLVLGLKHDGMALYVFSPLAGGFLTGRYCQGDTTIEPGSPYDPFVPVSKYHRGESFQHDIFRAVAIIREAAEKHNFTPGEVDLRWLKHHPTLDASMGNAIMVGTSSAKHLERNLEGLENEPLYEDVVAVVGEGRTAIKGVVSIETH